MGMYYNTIIGWAVYYFLASFTTGELPWTSCDQPWNTNSCALIGPSVNGSLPVSPAQEYFESVYCSFLVLFLLGRDVGVILVSIDCQLRRNVLQTHLSDGLDDVGPIKWSLAFCVLAVFVLVYFSLWKGVRSTGKVSKEYQSNKEETDVH